MSDYDDDMMYDSEAEDVDDEPDEDDLEVQTENKYFEAKGSILTISEQFYLRPRRLHASVRCRHRR